MRCSTLDCKTELPAIKWIADTAGNWWPVCQEHYAAFWRYRAGGDYWPSGAEPVGESKEGK